MAVFHFPELPSGSRAMHFSLDEKPKNWTINWLLPLKSNTIPTQSVHLLHIHRPPHVWQTVNKPLHRKSASHLPTSALYTQPLTHNLSFYLSGLHSNTAVVWPWAWPAVVGLCTLYDLRNIPRKKVKTLLQTTSTTLLRRIITHFNPNTNFIIARQHTAADARYWYSNSVRPSVCPSVRPSVRDTLVLYENGLTYRHSFSTIR